MGIPVDLDPIQDAQALDVVDRYDVVDDYMDDRMEGMTSPKKSFLASWHCFDEYPDTKN